MPSRDFISGTSKLELLNQAPPIAVPPFHVMARFKLDINTGAQDGIWTIFRLAVPRVAGDGWFSVEVTTSVSEPPGTDGFQVRAYTSASVGRGPTTTTAFASIQLNVLDPPGFIDRWLVAGGFWGGTASRTAYAGILDAGATVFQASNTTTVQNPSGVNSSACDLQIGNRPNVNAPIDGHVADVTQWNRLLSVVELQAYFDGDDPRRIAPQDQVGFISCGDEGAPLMMRGLNGEGPWNVTSTNTTLVDDGPPSLRDAGELYP